MTRERESRGAEKEGGPAPEVPPSAVRVAWVLPSMARGFYLQPVLAAFARRFPHTRVFTGRWPGYAPGCEGAFEVSVVGRMRFVALAPAGRGYERGFGLPSLRIVAALWRFRPAVVFCAGFGLWTLLALALQRTGGWRSIVVYDGSSPAVDRLGAPLRLWLRRRMARRVSAFVTNSRAGRRYLVETLGAPPAAVFGRPYLVASRTALLAPEAEHLHPLAGLARPVFLCVGQLIPRKGVRELLEAAAELRGRSGSRFSLAVIGDGPARAALEKLARRLGLDGVVRWCGWVEYGRLGAFLRDADVLVFPTLDDIWGMVPVEAMLFATPVICSSLAGTAELVDDGETGLVVDPRDVSALSNAMARFIAEPGLAARMGEKARRAMAAHTPQAAAEHLARVCLGALRAPAR